MRRDAATAHRAGRRARGARAGRAASGRTRPDAADPGRLPAPGARNGPPAPLTADRSRGRPASGTGVPDLAVTLDGMDDPQEGRPSSGRPAELDLVDHALMRIDQIPDPVLAALAGDRQQPDDRVDAGTHVAIEPAGDEGHALASGEFVHGHVAL